MRLSKTLFVASLATALVGGSFAPAAQADVVSISRTFSGFEFEKTTLSSAMKLEIKNWLLSNGDFTQVSCFGFTGYNVFNRTKKFMDKLAKTRASATCNYVKAIASSAKIVSIGGVPSSSKNPSSRRVTITISKEGSGFGGGSGGGQGNGVTATCDDQVLIKMRSRLFRGDLYFGQMNISDISANCKGKQMDIYLTDSNSNELAKALDLPISGSTLTLLFSSLTTPDVKSTDIAGVAISIK